MPEQWPVGGIFYCEGRGLWECRGVMRGDPELVVFWNKTLGQSLSLPLGSPQLDRLCPVLVSENMGAP